MLQELAEPSWLPVATLSLATVFSMVTQQNRVVPFSQSWVPTSSLAVVHLLATVPQVVGMIVVMVELLSLIAAAPCQLIIIPL